ncbi:MAG: Ni/Fe hydrogenase subunit gamma, partial [Hyphomicrobiales bacterium]|nr:Ni/Fe hydrogenase subunit gamma [Hyphomicrobiales bacterium]
MPATAATAATALPADPMVPVPYRITRVARELSDTFTVDLVPARGKAPFRFAPGQFNMLYVYGVGEVPISISGDPADGARVRHTIRAVGTVTDALRRLKKGAMVGLRGPFGTPWPLDLTEGCDVLIIGGGVGLAPLRPAIYEVLNNRDRYGK